MVIFPTLPAILSTISSKRFKKLVIGPITWRVPESWAESDKVFRSVVERLYKLGAVKPLTMVLGIPIIPEGRPGVLDLQRIWPLFCEVGVVVEEYWDFWAR